MFPGDADAICPGYDTADPLLLSSEEETHELWALTFRAQTF